MAYSLVAVSKKSDEKIISVYSSSKNEYKEKVNIWDIDKITSAYSSKENFMGDLRASGIIDYDYGYTYIIGNYNGKELKYKNIYNSKIINECSNNVSDSKIDSSKVPEYAEYCNKIYEMLISDEKFRNEIETSYYIKSNFKSILLNYNTLLKNDNKSLEEVYKLSDLRNEIFSKLNEYKTFRQMYILVEEYKKEKTKMTYYNPKKWQKEKNKHNTTSAINTTQTKTYEITFNYADLADLNHGNREYEEFLDEEEYEDAYGKGGRHI